MPNSFKLISLDKADRHDYLAVVERTVRYGFLWRHTRTERIRVLGSSTVFYDYDSGERVDISPLSRFVQRHIILKERPEVPNG